MQGRASVLEDAHGVREGTRASCSKATAPILPLSLKALWGCQVTYFIFLDSQCPHLKTELMKPTPK